MEGIEFIRRSGAAAAAPPSAKVGRAAPLPAHDETGGSREVHFAPRSSIYLEGDAASCVYQITRGCVMLAKLLPDGRRQIVEVLGAGDVFGFSPGPVQDCSAETLAATWCTTFDRQALEHSPALMRSLSQHLYQQLCALHDHVTLLGRKSALERITSFLMRCIPGRGGLDCRGPHAGDDGAQIRLSMTRQEIADYLGLTIETVSRLLTRLKRKGLVSISKLDEICVHDVCRVCLMTGTQACDDELRGPPREVVRPRG